MKTQLTIFVAVITMLLSSCSSNFYQVYTVKHDGKLDDTKNNLVYENEDYKVTYRLWAEAGNMDFSFYNKTDKNLYIDLQESFFVMNGLSGSYFLNRTSSHSRSTMLYSSIVNKSESSVMIKEKKIICVPPKTYNVVSEYAISQKIFKDCDFKKYPNKRQISEFKFDKENSPYVFENIISYKKEGADDYERLKHNFYVNSLTNLPGSAAFDYLDLKNCKGYTIRRVRELKNSSPYKFYNSYSK